jgi:predicted phosphodiesterase
LLESADTILHVGDFTTAAFLDDLRSFAPVEAVFPRCDAIAYGHTHVPEVSRAGAVWILNPGSPTERRRAPGHSLIVVDGGVPRLVALDA